MAAGIKTGGRQKGTRNGATSNAKNAIEQCFEDIGGIQELAVWAKDNRDKFYTQIWPKILPLTVAGDKDNPIQARIAVEFVGKV